MLSLLLAAGPQVVTDTLLRDLRTLTGPTESVSRQLEVGTFGSGATLIQATDPDGVERLFVTDGTGAGTFRLDLPTGPLVGEGFYPSSKATGRMPQGASLGDGRVVFFGAGESLVGQDPFVTDGTPEGTVDLQALPAFSGLTFPGLQPVGSEVAFLVLGGLGWTLWVTDGTVAGTRPEVLDLFATGSGGSLELRFGGDGSELIAFQYLQEPDRTRVVKTDGTTAGTLQLGELVGPAGLETGVQLAGSQFVFDSAQGLRAYDPATGALALLFAAEEVLWTRTQGVRVFAGVEAAGVPTLVVTDGTTAGTQALGTFAGLDDDGASGVASLANGIVFPAALTAGDVEPWFSDGTVGGTALIQDVQLGSGGSFPEGAVAFGGDAYFFATGSGTGRELWRSDGTAAGTQLVRDYASGPNDSVLQTPLFATAGGVVFLREDPQLGLEPHVSQGTALTTNLLAEFAPQAGESSEPLELTRVGDEVFFSAEDDLSGRELWASDGTAAGTRQVKDIVSVFGSSNPVDLFEFEGRLFFEAALTSQLGKLWTSDGTEAGTFAFPEPANLGFVPGTSQFTVADGQFFFRSVKELWCSDGTPAGTRLIDGFGNNLGIGQAANTNVLTSVGELGIALVRSNGSLAPDLGPELYAFDGTPGGFELLRDTVPGSAGAQGAFGVATDSVAFVVVNTAGLGLVFLYTDGTAAGTGTFSDLGFTVTPLLTSVLGATRSHGFWIGAGELWSSDGTAAGTQPLVDFSLGSVVQQFDAGDSLAYFLTAGGTELWRSDGTPAGTFLVESVSTPVAAGVELLGFAGTEGAYLWEQDDPQLGREVWITDGTPGSGRPLADSNPAFADGAPEALVRVDDQLLFSAVTELEGRELHAVPFAATEASLVQAFGMGCSGVGFANRLDGTGPAVLGGAVQLDVSEAQPGGLAALVYSTDVGLLDVGAGCTLYALAPVFLQTLGLDGAGAASTTVGLPSDPALAGLRLVTQAALVEAGGPYLGLFGLSSGVELIVGP